MSLFGGLFGGGKAPKFDAQAAITAQQNANNTATANNAKAANKTGPFGSTLTTTDANGMPTGQTSTLAAPLGSASDNFMGGVNDASGWTPQQPFKLSDVPNGMPLADATFQQGMNYMRPEFDRQNKNLEVRMAERGLPVGSEAWSDANSVQQDSQNRAVTDLTQRSILMTPAEEQRQIGNAVLERNMPYQDAQTGIGLLGGLKGLLPDVQSVTPQTPVNAAGAYQQQFASDQAAYQAKQAAMQNAIKMGAGLAFSPIGGTSLVDRAYSGLFGPSPGSTQVPYGTTGP